MQLNQKSLNWHNSLPPPPHQQHCPNQLIKKINHANFQINTDFPQDLLDYADTTLQEIDDFSTIDDQTLSNIIYESTNDNSNNSNSNKIDTPTLTYISRSNSSY